MLYHPDIIMYVYDENYYHYWEVLEKTYSLLRFSENFHPAPLTWPARLNNYFSKKVYTAHLT